mmetsp:Transcript_2517/g.7206  ORF Transcript_2517/g.7206 Transcript_2517/m.7206 type:complete len:100 (+) Transcript_2517:120-419(+)
MRAVLLLCSAALCAAFVAQPSRPRLTKAYNADPRERGNVDDDPSYEDVLDSGIDYKKDASGRVTPAAMTVGEGMALKDVIAPELWKDFGLDENGDPIEQ